MLTVVIPTKNNEQVLMRNIQLHFENMLPINVHLLIHDNSDTPSASIRSLCEKLPNTRYIYIPNRISVGENFHLATEHVDTDYFCFIGDDDFISFGRWGKISNLLQLNTYDHFSLPIYSLYFWKSSSCKYLTDLDERPITIQMGPILSSVYFHNTINHWYAYESKNVGIVHAGSVLFAKDLLWHNKD